MNWEQWINDDCELWKENDKIYNNYDPIRVGIALTYIGMAIEQYSLVEKHRKDERVLGYVMKDYEEGNIPDWMSGRLLSMMSMYDQPYEKDTVKKFWKDWAVIVDYYYGKKNVDK